MSSVLSPTSTPANGEGQLHAFAELFGQTAGALLAASGWVTYIVGPELRIKHFLGSHTAATEHSDYEEKFAALDPLAPAACLSANCWVARFSERFDPGQAEHRRYRDEFFHPHGLVDAMELFLRSEAGLIVGCSLLRHGASAPFTGEDVHHATALKQLGDFTLSRAFPTSQASPAALHTRFPDLTPREVTLVQLVAAGLNNKQLCRELDISLPTVKSHLLNIFRKLGIGSRTELVAKVLG